MKPLFLALFFFVVLAAAPVRADDVEEIPAARAAVVSWLAMTDARQYGPSWDNTSAPMKKAVTRDQWEQSLVTARAPLGSAETRSLKSLTYTKILPGAPEGHYVIIQYNTDFENKDRAVETLTAMKEDDQKWRVSGYLIN